MNTLCVGGSFNPIHYGHLRCAAAVARGKSFDRVLLIPSAQPPHKPATTDLAAATDRLAMCRLAADSMNALTPGQSVPAPPRLGPHFDVDDLELRRAGPSYTLDTVREFKRRGWTSVWWMIGADMLLFLPKWHRAEELVHEVNFVVVARPGWRIDWSQLPQPFQPLQACVTAAPLVDISATDLRRRVKAGQSIDGLTPPAVVAYIAAKGLYS